MIGPNTTANGAELRRHRADLAVSLAKLIDKDNNVFISFSAIDKLPCWISLEQQTLQRVVRLVGSVSLLPQVRQCICGATLRQISDLIGERDFQWLLQLDHSTVNISSASNEENATDTPDLAATPDKHDAKEIVDSIEPTGAAILYGLISDEAMHCVAKKKLESVVSHIREHNIAGELAMTNELTKTVVQMVETRLSESNRSLQEHTG